MSGAAWLLVGAVGGVGVLHTIVPDHWVPITLVARQRGWTKREIVNAAAIAGSGHTLSTLLIGLLVWLAGVAFATKFGTAVSIVSSIALIAFGAWIAISSLRDLRAGSDHSHSHHHHAGHADAGNADVAGGIHGPEIVRIGDMPPHFRISGHGAATVRLETLRDDGSRQRFDFEERGEFAQSLVPIPEPHRFDVTLTIDDGERTTSHRATFSEAHDHGGERPLRTTLLLILGSSPMVEGLPAFFAASKYGLQTIALMAIVFAASTIATYVALCTLSVAGLRRVRLGPLERYGEVLSGAFIASVGLFFLMIPIY